ncbi:hypothetical protein [Salegentibacter chungangensis]|uniref:Uncharacterized protein n=1 Tax=Salegentibacter chungangensis TaxID=1335724 RepID=A0ABW3NRR6_9FLAO
MGKRIPPKDATDLLKNWLKGPGNAIKGKGLKDAYETWFSIEELEKYIKYVKEHIPAEEKPGIRVYYGKYAQGGGPNPTKGLTTVFLAPTKEEEQTNDDGSTEMVNSNDYSLEAYNDGSTKWPPTNYNSI